MKVPTNVVDELIKGANSDIRQVLNMLSTFKLGKAEMDFDEGKAMYVSCRYHLPGAKRKLIGKAQSQREKYHHDAFHDYR